MKGQTHNSFTWNMNIFKTLFWKTNANARDVNYYLSELFTKEGFTSEFTFEGSEKHIIYSNGTIDFDFWWQRGNRPTLFLRNNGEQISTTVFESLRKKCGPKQTVGEQIYYINAKMDKDDYYGEHLSFILNYIKNNTNVPRGTQQ